MRFVIEMIIRYRIRTGNTLRPPQIRRVENMTIAMRLRSKMNEKGLGENELGRRAGVPQPTIHRILHGDSKTPRKATIEKLARVLGVTPEWLLFGSSHGNVEAAPAPHREAKEYPLISWIAAGAWAESCGTFQPDPSTEQIASDAYAGECGYWLEVLGDSMTPAQGNGFMPGMRVLVQPEGFDLVSGKFYIARLGSTGETTLKQYVRDSGISYLKPLNTEFKMIVMTDDVEIIGRVVDVKFPSTFL
jgi:SOS-response transcriptional repressor LexA